MDIRRLLAVLKGQSGTVTKGVGRRAVSHVPPRPMPPILGSAERAALAKAQGEAPAGFLALTAKQAADVRAIESVLYAWAAHRAKTATIDKAAARILMGDAGLDAVIETLKAATAKKKLRSA